MISLPRKREADFTPGTRQAKQVAWLALFALGGIVYFFVAVVAMHVLRPEFNPVNHAVGFLLTGDFRL